MEDVPVRDNDCGLALDDRSRQSGLYVPLRVWSTAVPTGGWDGLFADTFDPVDNTYGGGPILGWSGYTFIPDNILIMLGWA